MHYLYPAHKMNSLSTCFISATTEHCEDIWLWDVH